MNFGGGFVGGFSLAGCTISSMIFKGKEDVEFNKK